MGVRVAVVSPQFPPAVLGGGPIRTLSALVQQAPEWAQVHVFTSSRDHGATNDIVDVVNGPSRYLGTRVTYVQPHRPAGWCALFRGLREFAPEILYLNSYWSLTFSQLVMLVHRSGWIGQSVVVLAPRGEFARAALARHHRRKALLHLVHRLLALYRHVIWHASTECEAQEIRAYVGHHARIVVREDDNLLPADPLPSQPGSVTGSLRAVFLGRLVEHKGALLAIEAASRAGDGVTLDVYGPEEDAGYATACRAAAGLAGGRVRFPGVLKPEDVRTTLAAYDVLVMPTRSENFGHVIAEALSASLPVVVPDVTPWSEVIRERDAGDIVSRDASDICSVLRRRAAETPEAKQQARRTAAAAFRAWRGQSKRLPHLFEKLVELGAMPRTGR